MASETCPLMSMIASFDFPASAILADVVAKVMEPALDARSRAHRVPGRPQAGNASLGGSPGMAIPTQDAWRRLTEGVECRKDEDVIDEAPVAYKSIDTVMAGLVQA